MQGLYCLSTGHDMLASLAAGIRGQWGHDPLLLGGIRLFLPTRRARQAFRRCWWQGLEPGSSLPMPQLFTLGEPEAESLFWQTGWTEERRVIPPMERRFALAGLIRELNPDKGMPQAVGLAESLAILLDEWQREEVDVSQLDRLLQDQPSLAEHWQRTLAQLDVIRRHWPERLKALRAEEPILWRARQWDRLIEHWEEHPPQTPVILAGSTGSQPVIRRLMRCILHLPQGVVVLPDAEIMAGPVNPLHPQAAIGQLLGQDLASWAKTLRSWPAQHRSGPDRQAMLHHWMLPADAAEDWRQAGEWGQALTGLHCLQAEDEWEEARLVAMVLREGLATPGKQVALVTPDRALARRVGEWLQRWNLQVTGSAGEPLLQTGGARLLAALLQWLAEDHPPADRLLAILKHPWLMRDREAEQAVAELERHILRRYKQRFTPASLLRLVERGQGLSSASRHWLTAALEALRPLTRTPLPLDETLLTAATRLCGGETRPAAWQGESARALDAWLEQWRQAGSHLTRLTIREQAGLMLEQLRAVDWFPYAGGHSRLSILTPLEARMLWFDRVVLAGWNEGVWPARLPVDPWLNRGLRARLGLPPAEQAVGRSAHDVYGLLQLPEVFLTRSRKLAGAPQTPSRWWQRLEALLRDGDRSRLPDETERWRQAWHAWQGIPAARPLTPPRPVPPLEARPRELSASDIERWQSDPYRLYAQRILQLRPLDLPEEELTSADFGNWLHAILEHWINELSALPEAEQWAAVEVFARRKHPEWQELPVVKNFWWPRLERLWPELQALHRERRLTADVRAECQGRAEWSWLGGSFALTARADRLETGSDGALTIVDYKTGGIPSEKAVRDLSKPQLAVEALLAARGGYGEGLVPQTVEFWKLSHRAVEPCSIAVAGDKGHLTEAMEERLQTLLTAYADPAMPYLASPVPSRGDESGDYAHLERLKEWRKMGGE